MGLLYALKMNLNMPRMLTQDLNLMLSNQEAKPDVDSSFYDESCTSDNCTTVQASSYHGDESSCK